MGKHNRSVIVAVYGTPYAIYLVNSNSVMIWTRLAPQSAFKHVINLRVGPFIELNTDSKFYEIYMVH
jgi:hypothetical protein